MKNKKLLKNPWILAGILLGIELIISFIINIVMEMLGSSRLGVGGIIAASSVGQIYANAFKEIMPKILRLKVTGIYMAVQVIVGSLYIYFFESIDIVLICILLGVFLIYSLLVYWLLGSSGKMYLKALEKRKTRK